MTLTHILIPTQEENLNRFLVTLVEIVEKHGKKTERQAELNSKQPLNINEVKQVKYTRRPSMSRMVMDGVDDLPCGKIQTANNQCFV